MARRTLYKMFRETTNRHGDRPAVGFRQDKASEIEFWTYSELDRRVRELRKSLDALGIVSGDRVAILAENRVEWPLVDLAAQSLGIVIVAPYSSLPAAQVSFIVKDSGAK